MNEAAKSSKILQEHVKDVYAKDSMAEVIIMIW